MVIYPFFHYLAAMINDHEAGGGGDIEVQED